MGIHKSEWAEADPGLWGMWRLRAGPPSIFIFAKLTSICEDCEKYAKMTIITKKLLEKQLSAGIILIDTMNGGFMQKILRLTH